ncbi:MAG: hypothetical protein ABFS39_19240 [Pseudomonadota bacterium]
MTGANMPIAENRKIIHSRIARLIEQFVEVLESEGTSDSSRLFASTITSLMLDVIEHAVSYADNPAELEAITEQFQDAIDMLEVEIAVWKESAPVHREEIYQRIAENRETA